MTKQGGAVVDDIWREEATVSAYGRYLETYPLYTEAAAALISHAGLCPGDRVVDLCCGTGAVASAAQVLVGDSGRVVGVDSSLPMLKKARERSATDFICCAAEDIGQVLREGIADAVMCSMAIWQLEVNKVLSGVVRCLKPRGIWAFNVASRSAVPGVFTPTRAYWAQTLSSVEGCEWCFWEDTFAETADSIDAWSRIPGMPAVRSSRGSYRSLAVVVRWGEK